MVNQMLVSCHLFNTVGNVYLRTESRIIKMPAKFIPVTSPIGGGSVRTQIIDESFEGGINIYVKETIEELFNQNYAIDISDYGAVNGQDNATDLQAIINHFPHRDVVIPEGFTCYTGQLITIPSKSRLVVNGLLSVTPGHVRRLTKNALIGSNTLYVDNHDGVFKVGEYLSASSDIYPVGGSGEVERRIGQGIRVLESYPDRILIEYPLQPVLISLICPDLLVSDNAMVGHSKSLLYLKNVNDVIISGSGTLYGAQPTMHSVYPYSVDQSSEYFLIEEARAGNLILADGCTNLIIKGINGKKLKLQEANLATLIAIVTTVFEFRDLEIFHPYMKHIACGDLSYGVIEDVDCLGSYNEDGITFHHNVSFVTVRNCFITGARRGALLVGSNATDNNFINIKITNSRLSLYSFIAGTQTDAQRNYFKDIYIDDCEYGPVFRRSKNSVFDNLQVHFIRASGHCLAFYGGCTNLVFNDGGVYDTRQHPRNGRGLAFAPKVASEVNSNIVLNQFKIIRTEKAFENQGTNAVATLNNCIVSDNQINGDIADSAFIHNGTILDGNPYP